MGNSAPKTRQIRSQPQTLFFLLDGEHFLAKEHTVKYKNKRRSSPFIRVKIWENSL